MYHKLSGTYCHKTGTRPPSCAKPQQPKVAGFDSPYVLEMKERNLVSRANRLLLVNCYDNKKVKSPYNWAISPLTQPQVANQQKNKLIKLKFNNV